MTATPLDAFGASADRLATLVEPLTPVDLRRSAYPTEWTIADVLSHLGSGAVIMRLRIDAALSDDDVGIDLMQPVPDDASGLVVDSLGLIASFAAQPTGADRTITIRTTTPTRGFEITMRPDGVTFSPTAPDGVDGVDLELPAEALIRLVYGRLDPAHTPPVDGSPADLEELRRTFPGI